MTRVRRAAVALAALALAAGCSRAQAPQASTEHPAGPAVAPSRPAAAASASCWSAAAIPGRGSLAFSDATAAAGLERPLVGVYGHAAAAGDVDGDGWVDLFVGTFADKPDERYRVRGAPGPSPDRLLLGGADGFRVDERFPAQRGRTSGAAFADLDGDDDLDLVLARNVRDRAPEPTAVLANDGGRFRLAGTLVPDLGARSVGVLDYDGDGQADLFVAEDRWSGGSSVLLRNTGDLTFADATAEAGLPGDVDGLGVGAADLTGDGWPDLFVSGSNRLFVNNRDGTFREADSSPFAWARYGDEDDAAGVAVGDVNRDGRPDLVVGQHYNSTVDRGRRVPVHLYLHGGLDAGGDPVFSDVTEAAGLVGLATKAPHVEVADVDNDAWPDLVTSASAADGTRPAVFRGLGLTDGVPRFAAPAGLGAAQYWVTGATVDADRDGRLDLFVVEWEPARPSLLLRNVSPGGHWLEVEVAPATALGSVVEVYAAGGLGDPAGLLARREVTASTGYGAGAAPVVHVGLGEVEAVDVALRPPRGQPLELRGIAADRHLSLPGGCGR